MSLTRIYTPKIQDTISTEARMQVESGYYQHFKGNVYQVIGVGKHSETTEELVVYKGLYDSPHGYGAIWIRPVEMFLGDARPGIRRFVKITDAQAEQLLNKSKV